MPFIRYGWLAFLFCCLPNPLTLGPAARAVTVGAAAADTTTIEEIRVGIEGTYKVGQWTAVHVRVRAGEQGFRGTLTAQVADPHGVESQFVGPSWEIAAGQTALQTTYVKFGQPAGPLRVVLTGADGQRISRQLAAGQFPPSLASDQQVVLVLGGDPTMDLQALRASSGLRRTVDRRVNEVADLPSNWLGYAGVDVLLLLTSRDEPLDKIDAQQWRALREWVELGGTVIACGASGAERWFGADGPLVWLVPGQLQGVTKQRVTLGIEQFVGATQRLDEAGQPALEFSLPMARLQQPRGRVEVSEGYGAEQAATVVRGAVGLGRVVFVAFDVDRPPFAGWPDRPRLLAKLLNFALDESSEDEALNTAMGPVKHLGFTDIVGQLRQALDQFTGVRLVPFSWIAGLMAVYIALIGPLDFWLLRRLGRPEWTWLTFGLSVVLFTGLAVGLANHWKGDQLRSNQVTLLDVAFPGGTVRGTTWAHVFSPRTRQVALQTQPDVPFDWSVPAQQATCWQGLPGDGFGGLDRRRQAESFRRPYQVQLQFASPELADVRVEKFPIPAWSSRGLLGQWWGQARLAPGNTQLTAGADASLSGTVVNPLPIDLSDVYLVYERWALRVGSWKSGASFAINNAVGVDLQALLTERKVVNGRNAVTPWRQENRDVDRVMQMLMFYGAVKGRAYTRLQHRFQRTLDWSDHPTAGQAVLWGRSSAPAAQLLLDGQPIPQTQTSTYVRLLVPVTQPGDN